MFRNKMDIMLKLIVMPFTEYDFYEKDYIEELSNKELIEEYKLYLNNVLFKKVYNIINKTQRINNLDEINLLFNKFYSRTELIKENNITSFYMWFISKLSKSLISHRNGRIALKYWESDGEEDFIGPYKGINKVALWNSLNRMFTTDLLVIRYLIDNNMNNEAYLDGYYSSIMLEDLQLEQVLKKGVAETHIHKGAAINFYISWQQLMTIRKKVKNHKDELFFDDVIGKNLGLKNYVAAMAIVRLLMAYFLEVYEGKNNYTFDKYLEENFKNPGFEKNDQRDNEIYKLFKVICEGEQILNDDYRFSNLWDRCKEKLKIKSNININKNLIQEDILNNIFYKEKNIKTAMENVFLFKCISYMDNNKNDSFFCKVFWQYIRIKNEVFQLKVQGNSIRGLVNFVNYFKRSTDIEVDNSKEYWKIIMLNQFQNAHLKKLELRSGFGSGNSVEEFRLHIKNTLKSFLEAYREIINDSYVLRIDGSTGDVSYREAPNVGLVFHMIKDVDKKEPEKCWQNYCGVEDKELHFKELQEKYKRQVEALNDVREEIPGLSEYILGIDAASIENNTEPWVFAPVYEEARDSSRSKIVHIANSTSMNRIKSLGFTFHVGEDFRHIMTGIRRIDEVVEHFKFHAGDRIGHGMALGINVDSWINNNKIVILPRGEYLENLLWIWGIYKDGNYIKSFDMGYLEQEIMKNCEKIYINIEGITVYNIWKAYRKKFKAFEVNETYKSFEQEHQNVLFCRYVKESQTKLWNEEKLTHAQHCQIYLEKMIEPIQVEIKSEDAEMISQIQKIVASKISSLGIIVETNPTSNVAIGEIENIFEHYAYNLNQRGLSAEIKLEKAVMITINSDDPSVFNTNVSNEFAYIFYSLQEKGYSREDILIWIDKIRRYGMEYSFIDDRGLNTKQRIEEIEVILKHLKS
ncbi:amidohydrolase family protein [Clostridium tagluense]|uniref:hypothetical protein n=1 Tax=Clostridium tagluense TaxID=360422 RepID=UPI001CF1B1EC|nr:hypothetical protein [Clostridium tagluense]MCB2300273.1 hypothetical protein [Clostridium tagluense]